MILMAAAVVTVAVDMAEVEATAGEDMAAGTTLAIKWALLAEA